MIVHEEIRHHSSERIACSSLCSEVVLRLVEWNGQDTESPPKHISRESDETIPGVYTPLQFIKQQPQVSFLELVAAGHEKNILASFDIAAHSFH